MTLFEKIKSYLENKDRDFETGLSLYIMASHQRSIMLYLQRKKDAKKLEYELGKLLKLIPDRLKKIALPEESIPYDDKLPVTGDSGMSASKTAAEPIKTDSAATTTRPTNTDTPVVPEDEHKIIEFKKVNPEDLPEELRPVYDNVCEAHKQMRTVHEKMKQAETDEDRAELRETLILLDDTVKAGWGVIDEFLLIAQQKKDEVITDTVKVPVPETVNELGKAINAARTYISRGIGDYKKAAEEKKPELKKKIIKRIDLLIENKVSVTKETKAALVELNIIAKNSKLLVE